MNILKALSKFFGRYISFFIPEKEKDSPDREITGKRFPKGEKRVIKQTKDKEHPKGKPESEIVKKSDETLDFQDHNNRLEDLQEELNLLNNSFANEIGIHFTAKNKTAVNQISARLIPEFHIQNLIPEYEEVNNRKRSKRKEEILKIQNLKKEILSFSLVEIHIKREEKRKEKERLEKERRLDEEFSKLINISEKEVSNRDFQKAAENLKKALKVRPERAEEIDKHLEKVSNEEIEYKEALIEEKFLDLIESSGNALNNLDFKKARSFLNEALEIRPKKKKEIQTLLRKADKAEKDYEIRRIERKYINHRDRSKEALASFDFIKAASELEKALEIVPEKKVEIQLLQKEVAQKQEDFKTRKKNYNKIFNEAEECFHHNDLETAIKLYENAALLNINTQLCKRRISDAKNKIERIKKLEQERLERERIEKIRREKYKEDGDEIISFYQSKGISQFYHYTDSRNLNSILQNNGLFSLNELKRRRINFLQGSETGEKPDFVRLSYTSDHPLKYVSINKGRIRSAKILKIDLEVAKLKKTQFSNVNAARTYSYPTVTFGNDLNYIRENVRFNVVKQRNQFSLSEDEKPYYQAEILVQDHLEIEYITNLKA